MKRRKNGAIVTAFAAAQVPDGGAPVMLLGAGLGALGLARRFLMA
jgi:protein with PEP-CTERM/exosortase system signal